MCSCLKGRVFEREREIGGERERGGEGERLFICVCVGEREGNVCVREGKGDIVRERERE